MSLHFPDITAKESTLLLFLLSFAEGNALSIFTKQTLNMIDLKSKSHGSNVSCPERTVHHTSALTHQSH